MRCHQEMIRTLAAVLLTAGLLAGASACDFSPAALTGAHPGNRDYYSGNYGGYSDPSYSQGCYTKLTKVKQQYDGSGDCPSPRGLLRQARTTLHGKLVLQVAQFPQPGQPVFPVVSDLVYHGVNYNGGFDIHYACGTAVPLPAPVPAASPMPSASPAPAPSSEPSGVPSPEPSNAPTPAPTEQLAAIECDAPASTPTSAYVPQGSGAPDISLLWLSLTHPGCGSFVVYDRDDAWIDGCDPTAASSDDVPVEGNVKFPGLFAIPGPSGPQGLQEAP